MSKREKRDLLPLLGIACVMFLYAAAKPKAGREIQPSSTKNASMSFIVLGDLHYDKLEYHDMEWLATKPGDLKQVTDTYVPNTEKNWDDLMNVLKRRIETFAPPVKAVVQLGDLAEGLAGTPEKADLMASGTIATLRATALQVPWLLAGGNHDITGPGAKEALAKHYVPFIREETGNAQINSVTYTYRIGNAQFVMIDPWDSSVDAGAFVEKSFAGSDAKYRFVVMHEPAIPATERCWHYLRRAPEQREKFLEVLARNKAIVLAAHLHRYSVIRRETPFGPIVQVMAISVVGNKRASKPSYTFGTSDYGPGLVDRKADYEPATAESRKAMLTEEAKYVTFYQMCDLAGYGIISIDDAKEEVILRYYAAFQNDPYDTVNLTELYRNNSKE